MITIPSLGTIAATHSNGCEISKGHSSSNHRSGSVLEMFLGSREQHNSSNSNRESREGSMGPPSRQSSNASACSVSSLHDAAAASSGSQFFEVLYLGKIKSVSHRKAPPTFIDDVLEKFRAHNEMEEQKVRQTSLPVPGSQLAKPNGLTCHDLRSMFARKLVDTQEESDESPATDNKTLAILQQTGQVLQNLHQDGIQKPQADTVVMSTSPLKDFRTRTASGDETTLFANRLSPIGNEQPARDRSSSMGSCNRPRRINSGSVLELPSRPNVSTENNRTMLLQISRCDVKLISPDRKSVLLSRPFCDISHCSQGVQHTESFGFICRDATSESNNVCYVFKCQNSSVADEILAVLKLASHSAAESQKRIQGNICEQCPAVWLQRLVQDVEGLSDQKAHSFLLKRINSLPEMDQLEIVEKYKGADLTRTNEQNDLLLMLLKAHCEAKQMTHVHDTAENRHEFLSQYFDRSSGAIFKKAKRSLTNSFDQLLKRKSKDSSPTDVASSHILANGTASGEICDKTPSKQAFRFDMTDGLSQSPLKSESPSTRRASETSCGRQRSSTLCSSHGDTIKKELKDIQNKRRTSREQQEQEAAAAAEQSTTRKSPIMNLFFKVGSTAAIPDASSLLNRTPSPRKQPSSSSWRQAIFQQVKTPSHKSPSDYGSSAGVTGDGRKLRQGELVQRTREDYKHLWQKAIKQQILLIRMEKENKRLKAHQEEMAIKRMKLHYDEIVVCPRPIAQLWEKLLLPNNAMPDYATLALTMEKGVPKQRRGEAWRLLVRARNSMDIQQQEQQQQQQCTRFDDYSLCRQVVDYDQFPLLDVPYEELLGQLTSHQHAIIIDLGRTFPTQKYFQASLGAGQLALYNLLKAYSLLDSQVGYCQGLSFIAGLLLMHLEENEAYYMLRFLMLELGLRRQYLPDMAALQVQLYQMARLLRDLHRDLYEHLEENEVSPTLYAAPWFLTLFASQFPLGFVVRVFDLIITRGMSMIFRIVLSLLADHKDMLLQCRNMEQLMDYFKTTLPSMGSSQLERVIQQAILLDISRQLGAYEVEYHVLQEEIIASIASTPANAQQFQQQLQQQQQLAEDWQEKVQRLEESNQALQKQVRELQAQVQTFKVNSRILETNLNSSQSKCNRLERKLREVDGDRTALIHLVTNLMKRLPLGQEVVIPADLARCIQDFTIEEEGISLRL